MCVLSRFPFVVFSFFVSVGVPVLAEPPERLADSAVRLVDTAALLDIEDFILPASLSVGPAAHEELTEYYAAANPQLVDRFQRIDRVFKRFQSGEQPAGSCRAITLVAGDAGVGKTFLKKKVFRKGYPDGAVFKFDIREQYQTWLAEGIVTLRPDLYCGDQVINRLLAIGDGHDKPLLRLLESHNAHFVVIDSLDELHPDDYVKTLEQVEQFAFSPNRHFVHVVVFGRPCAFVDYWRSRASGVERERDLQLFLLNPPQLRTTGDLLVSSWNYCTWKFAAHCSRGKDTTTALSLAKFARWSDADFIRSGEFGDICYKANDELNATMRDTLIQYAKRYRVVVPLLHNLAGNSILREIVAHRVRHGRPYNEREIMDAYFEAWLERDYQSDGRPSLRHPDHVDLYLQLLQRVAIRYAQPGRIDQQGYFSVSATDQIRIVYDGRRLAFPIQRILDRSGLKHIDPREIGERRYRFEPIWMHRYLVERYNEGVLSSRQTALGVAE
jgi:hypothetical protein